MRRKTGLLCMVLGAVLLLSALSLLLYNRGEERQAYRRAREALSLVREAAVQQGGETAPPTPADPAESGDMAAASVGGYEYIGWLTIPALELELPVMAQWDDTRLRTAPCRQFGTAEGGDLVIAGHNYDCHFGRLRRLREGDLVQFTDMAGGSWAYEVAAVTVLPANAVDQVKNSPWELVLYTCTLEGGRGVAVGCTRV